MNINDIRQEMALLTRPIPLEGPRYAACLQTYEAASNQRALILEWFTDRVIPQLSTDNASVLSIGCGAGELDINILAAGKARASSISYVGLEPDSRQCERFIARMQSGTNQAIRIEGHNTRFENFTQERRFDLVIMVHSLYYMDSPERAIERALELLGERGRLVILIASNDRLNELSSSFWELEKPGSTWFSEDLSAHLTDLGIAFECERIKARLDITACCKPESEPDREKGIRIADFVAQVPTEELSPRLQEMILGYLDASSRFDDGLHWLPHNVDAFTIHSRQATLASGLNNASTLKTRCA